MLGRLGRVIECKVFGQVAEVALNTGQLLDTILALRQHQAHVELVVLWATHGWHSVVASCVDRGSVELCDAYGLV